MTVISTLITTHCTAHATDSFLTEVQPDGTHKVIASEQTKLVRVASFRGAMAYYGLARAETWSTIDWLRQRSGGANRFGNAEEFARDLAAELDSSFARIRFSKPIDKLLGIHFTAYERVHDYWIPEFFHIRNWIDPPYSAIRPEGFVVSRETYASLTRLQDRPDNHREEGFRMAVHSALQSGVILRFNNGDPILFNPIANALFSMVQELSGRGVLQQPAEMSLHLSLARRPVEIVTKLLTDVSTRGTRIIGGKPHDLGIAPDGTMQSTTGD